MDQTEQSQESAQPRHERLTAALLAFSAAQNEVGRQFARSQHLHTTDAAAIVEVLHAEDRGHPLTPARLAERVGLTTGATSTLLNRIEAAGHVTRTREHQDRRVVTLHTTPGSHELADAYFAPLGDRLDAVLDDFSDTELEAAERIVARLRGTIDAYLDEDRPIGDPR